MEEERQREGEVNAGTGEEKGESLGGRFKGASRNSEFTRRLFSLLSLPPPLLSFLFPLRSRGRVFPAPLPNPPRAGCPWQPPFSFSTYRPYNFPSSVHHTLTYFCATMNRADVAVG